MQALAYQNDVVRSHSIFKNLFGSTLHNVSKRDYPEDNFFDPEIECLDMDAYERSFRGVAQPTVDAVIGVELPNSGQKGLMLVELKMDCKGGSELSSQNCAAKITHTKDLLATEQPIRKEAVFIFRDNTIQSMRFRMRSMMHENKTLRNVEALSVSEFDKNVKSPESYPPKYENDYSQIYNALIRQIDNNEFEQYLCSVEYWLERLSQYQLQYKLAESKRLTECLKSAWHYSRTSGFVLTEDQEINVQLIEEDYPWIASTVTE